MKVSGISKARQVFDSRDAACGGILKGEVKAGRVLVITHEGPKGGHGNAVPTSYLKARHLGKCALITDGRFWKDIRLSSAFA